MQAMTTALRLAVVAAVALPTTAAAQHTMDHSMTPSRAVAVLMPTAGNTAHGTVTFTAVDGGVRITAHLEGLSPGDHGFHIHEFGDCSAADGTSAGGHFNPAGVAHAGPDATTRHVGDLGNVTANAQGVADYDRVDHLVALGGPNGVIGRGVIVHAQRDDLTSQPTGAAGARVACGVVGIAK
jgi:superoxide dismutase, Cu-Zn family